MDDVTYTIKSAELRNRIRLAAENNETYKVQWFVTKTFSRKTTIGNGIKQFCLWCDDVADKTGAHVCPIASIHRDEKRRVHIHGAILADRRIKYREVHNNWRCGYSWDALYEKGRGGINYLLTDHRYIPFHKPFCPGSSRCRRSRGCVALLNDDWKSLRFNQSDLASDPCVVAIGRSRLTTPIISPPPNIIIPTNRTGGFKIRRRNKEV